MVDLHCHSTYSDGTMKPERLLRYAKELGVEVLALTDHDTVKGIDDFLSHDTDVIRVPGVEISVDEKGTFHLVGLFIDHKDSALRTSLDKLITARRERNEKMFKKLSGIIGEEVREEDISDGNEGEIGRPHIAQFLLNKRVVLSRQEAFDKYLAKGRPVYVEKFKMTFEAANKMIQDAGGISILAHPLELKLNRDEYPAYLAGLKERGLDGIEVYCSSNEPADAEFFRKIADDNGLQISAGSDYHGENKAGIMPGSGKGAFEPGFEIYQNLLDYKQSR